MVLVIDNHTALIEDLRSWLTGMDIEIARRDSAWSAAGHPLVILSGGHDYSVLHHDAVYQEELALVRNCREGSYAVVGICLGFEIIAHALGGTLEMMPAKEKGEFNIEVIAEDPVFEGIRRMKVYESHRWRLTDPGPELVVLAGSERGIEAVRHKNLPIYGFQFHPEAMTEPAMSRLLLKNLTSLTLKPALTP